MKKAGLLLALVLVLAGNVFAHDAGDLMLNIEPVLGIVFPRTGTGGNSQIFGLEGAFRTTFHYYFLDYLGVNAGVGILGFFAFAGGNDSMDLGAALHFSFPVGITFSLQMFAVGAGITINPPLLGVAGGTSGGGYAKNYIGWYVDVGYDGSGRKDAEGGFGIAVRLSGSINKSIFEGYENYRYFALSIVWKPAMQLANLPIGGGNKASKSSEPSKPSEPIESNETSE